MHVKIASEFVALEVLAKFYKQGAFDEINNLITNSRKFIWGMGMGKGEVMTLKNAFLVVKQKTQSIFFPVQKNIAQAMGTTKVWRRKQYLITDKQIKDMHSKLLPGDIMLQRREWYLSNVGLPGFWTHVALYTGDAKMRKEFFKDDVEIASWLKSEGFADADFEKYLETKYPKAYAESLELKEDDSLPEIIEAISPKVQFTSLKSSAHADSLAVLRPRLSKLEKAKAIAKAFHYSGRPYDFNFDFLTDDELVCSELVYKSYEAKGNEKGINFPVKEVLGRNVTAPNDIAEQFASQYLTDKQQTDFIFFYDGSEKQKKSVKSDVEEFNQSHTRPKWHILIQE